MELQTSRHVFMSSVSHEVRTPCGSIVGALDVLRETSLSPIQLEMCGIISSESSAILTLVEDALSVGMAGDAGFKARELRRWQALRRYPVPGRAPDSHGLGAVLPLSQYAGRLAAAVVLPPLLLLNVHVVLLSPTSDSPHAGQSPHRPPLPLLEDGPPAGALQGQDCAHPDANHSGR